MEYSILDKYLIDLIEKYENMRDFNTNFFSQIKQRVDNIIKNDYNYYYRTSGSPRARDKNFIMFSPKERNYIKLNKQEIVNRIIYLVENNNPYLLYLLFIEQYDLIHDSSENFHERGGGVQCQDFMNYLLMSILYFIKMKERNVFFEQTYDNALIQYLTYITN